MRLCAPNANLPIVALRLRFLQFKCRHRATYVAVRASCKIKDLNVIYYETNAELHVGQTSINALNLILSVGVMAAECHLKHRCTKLWIIDVMQLRSGDSPYTQAACTHTLSQQCVQGSLYSCFLKKRGDKRSQNKQHSGEKSNFARVFYCFYLVYFT